MRPMSLGSGVEPRLAADPIGRARQPPPASVILLIVGSGVATGGFESVLRSWPTRTVAHFLLSPSPSACHPHWVSSLILICLLRVDCFLEIVDFWPGLGCSCCCSCCWCCARVVVAAAAAGGDCYFFAIVEQIKVSRCDVNGS